MAQLNRRFHVYLCEWFFFNLLCEVAWQAARIILLVGRKYFREEFLISRQAIYKLNRGRVMKKYRKLWVSVFISFRNIVSENRDKKFLRQNYMKFKPATVILS